MTIEKDYPNFKLLAASELNYEPLELSQRVEHKSSNPYGDWVGISVALKDLHERNLEKTQIKLLEIGTAHGGFLRTWVDFLESLNVDVIGFGVDSKLHGYEPYKFNEKMTFVEGSSTESRVINQFENEQFDFVFIDGCHCQGHCEKDAKNYWNKVKVGGFLGFHDTSPRFQGGTEQPKTEECSEDTHIGVVKGIEKSGIENNFSFFIEEYHTDDKFYGGVRIYKRIK